MVKRNSWLLTFVVFLVYCVLAIKYSTDRFNYLDEIVKVAELPYLDWQNSNGLIFAIFIFLFKGLSHELVFYLYVILTGSIFSYCSVRLFFNKVNLLGWAYFYLFILPLYSVQLRAGLAISLAYYSIINRRLLLSLLSIFSHYSIFAFYLISIRSKTLFLSGFALLIFIFLRFPVEKIRIYSQLYESIDKNELISLFNYKIIISVVALLYSLAYNTGSSYIRKLVFIGIFAYYLFNFYPIFAHRISEMLFFGVPFLFPRMSLTYLNFLIQISLLILFVYLGFQFIFNKSSLWSVQ